MRLTFIPAPAVVRILTVSGLLALAACASGEAAPASQAQDGSRAKLVRGYGCAQSAIAGRYSCARSLDRQAQREAAAQAPATCRSCGTALAN